MLDNILRSGYAFAQNEYELKIKYMMSIATLMLTAIFLFIMGMFFYILDDMVNMKLFLAGSLLSLVAIFIHRISGKQNYTLIVYCMTFLFFVLISYGYYTSPQTQAISAWMIIQVISALLVLNIALAVWITVLFSLLMFMMTLSTHEPTAYILLQISPVILALLYIYIINKKFQMSIYLLESLNNSLETHVKDRTKALEKEKDRLDYQAHYDMLTLLPNRLYLKEKLEESVDEKYSIFMVDLDRFKNINDVYGHIVGDSVLKIIASRLLEIKRENEFLSRMGGDEFILLAKRTTRKEQESLALKIIHSIEEAIYLENKTLYVSASVGIYADVDEIVNMNKIISFSDIAMFESKKKGRGGFKFYKSEMLKDMEYKVMLEPEMKRAFENDELELFYQPQIDVVNNKISDIEVLVRWNHPVKGFVYPDEFIARVEEIGIIGLVDYHILQKGMKQISHWLEEGYEVPRMSFNISVRHLHVNLFKCIQNLLVETKCPAYCIELEITEGYLIDDIETAIELFEKLKALDIHIALDDFGKGYSSLAYLKYLPVDKIKIDKSFLDNVPSGIVDNTIIASVLNIANTLDIQVVQEGVETQKQKDFLMREGFKYVQGYYYYKPMDVKEFESEVLHKLGEGSSLQSA